MTLIIAIAEARPEHAPMIAAIHIAARREAMPYLPELHAEQEIRAWFAEMVNSRPACLWIACCDGIVVGYIRLHGDDLDDLYVRPGWQGHGVGSALLGEAKRRSPLRLALSTFQQNARARAFYEARGFRAVGFTDGRNEEGVPDVQYLWDGA